MSITGDFGAHLIIFRKAFLLLYVSFERFNKMIDF